jgi:acetylornithine deacetylase/succinyl-diaminopimelate desuccinylase-like protein
MSRDTAISLATGSIQSGAFRNDVARRVAFATESQNPDTKSVLINYLDDELGPSFEEMGFKWTTWMHEGWPFLVAERMEDPARPTVLCYGHGDVVYVV